MDPSARAGFLPLEGQQDEAWLWSTVWDDLVTGRLRPWREAVRSGEIHLLAHAHPPSTHALDSNAAALLARVLSGVPRKAVAGDLGIALSTTTCRYRRALAKLDLVPDRVPLPVVLAAQGWGRSGSAAGARCASFEYAGRRFVTLTVAEPALDRLVGLSVAERAIAGAIIEGGTREEIARRRETSVHTVSRQFHAVFAAMGASGRYALIRSAVDRGCFGDAGLPTGKSPGGRDVVGGRGYTPTQHARNHPRPPPPRARDRGATDG